MDLTRDLCDRMRAQGGTDRMVRQNTSALRGFAAQAELLPPVKHSPVTAWFRLGSAFTLRGRCSLVCPVGETSRLPGPTVHFGIIVPAARDSRPWLDRRTDR